MTTNAVDGVDQLRDSIDQLVDWLGDPADAELEVAEAVAGHIQPPVRTGALARTVHAESESRGAVVKAGGDGAPYGAIVNAREHFMEDGLAAAESDALSIVTSNVQDHVDQLRGA